MAIGENIKLTGPYDSMREYLSALEAKGWLLKIKEVDQDKYEGTAFVYRMLDKMDTSSTPAIMFENIKLNGNMMEGPVFSNIYSRWEYAAMFFGVENVTEDESDMYRAVRNRLVSKIEKNNGQWPRIKPVVTDKKDVPCKEVIMKGDDVDILKFPFFKNNPGDVSQYINTGAVFMEDPELGRNVGTYRLQVKGKDKIGMNTEAGQHGWQFIMRAKRRGERSIPAAVALGTDPIVFSVSSTKVADLGQDELEFAGGLKGKPVELVKCETSNILVPAEAEIIIEGDIIIEEEDEGPYGEMYGYMGLQHKNFYMNIKAVTHKKKPWIINDFTGVTHNTNMIPWQINTYIQLKKALPYVVDMYGIREAIGITILSIDKRFPGQGISAGQVFLGMSTSKVAIVVDKDIDVTNLPRVLNAVATRWQPHPASLIINQAFSMGVDPSMKQRGISSKIVIDATRQLPLEGGPSSWPPVSRVLLEEKAPESFSLVDGKWQEYWKNWGKK
ncbi:MAG: UbiD family decarboxylase [Candidatus Schekmanbacteria bacterium]|nr:UbiD family decarboxylase [Candidatus Schekmanbacteria bacterium]